jgi:hypothetical protein
MVIFTRTFDLLSWLLPASEKFPKAQRFVVTGRLTSAALDFQESLFEANSRRGVERVGYLRAADAHLSKLRLYLRLAYQWHWLNVGQYEHVSKMIEEIWRLLGGWLKRNGAT